MTRIMTKALPLATVAALLLTGVTAPPAAAAPTYDRTPLGKFFQVSQQRIAKAPNGRLMGVRFVPSPIPGTQALQYTFRSTNSHGKPILASAALVRPMSALPNGNVLVYNDFINSLGIKCQPSFAFDSIHRAFQSRGKGSPYDNEIAARSSIMMAVATVMSMRGVTTILPDFLGLKSSYTANILGGHITLDAARAARQIKQANIRHSKMILSGYSGGAMVAGFASIMAPKYAPDLNLVGAVIGGPPVDMEFMARTIGNKRHPGFGLAMASMLGLEREYPKRMNITPRLSKKGRQLANRNRNACVQRVLDQWNNQSASTTMVNVEVRKQYRELKVIRDNSLINFRGAPRIPMYVWVTSNDPFVPHRQVHRTVRQWCKANPRLRAQYVDTHGPEHVSNFSVGMPFALAWISARFAGLPAPNNTC